MNSNFFYASNKIIILILLLFSNFAFSALKLISTSGASNVNTTDNIIYAGIAGTCTAESQNGLDTCNSCLNAELSPCNFNNIYPSLTLRLTFRSEGTEISSATSKFTFKSTAGTVEKTVAATPNSDFTVDVLWSEICPLFGSDSSCAADSDASISGSVDAGLDIDNNGEPDSENKLSIRFRLNNLNSLSDITNYSFLSGLCAEGSSSSVGVGGSANIGVCDIFIKSGDEKIIVKNYNVGAVASGALTPAFNDFPQTSFVLFYNQAADSTEAAKSTALSTITQQSQIKTFNLTSNGTDVELDNDRADGFENDSTYCFILANQNQAGNIFYFAQPSLYNTSEAINGVCVTASIAVGLLDDKSCFIATAAFGGPLANEVQTLREFRDQFLIPYDWGRDFVSWYYSWSPQAAAYITNSESLQFVASLLLWPLVIVSKVFLFLNFWPAVLTLLLFLVLLRSTFKKLHFFNLKTRKK